MSTQISNEAFGEMKKQFRVITRILPVLKYFLDGTQKKVTASIDGVAHHTSPLQYEGHDLYTREDISEGTGLKGSTLAKILTSGTENNFITETKKGNLKLYYLTEDQYIFGIELYKIFYKHILKREV